jgi:hypothetical protein
MDAGRQMDELVATKVMGYSLRGDYAYTKNEHGGETIFTFEPTSFGSFMPSTDITAAWEIIGKFDEISVRKYQTISPGFRYICRIDIDGEDVIANGLTAPEAICKAALLTLIERGESF